jgi:hypothetical protein
MEDKKNRGSPFDAPAKRSSVQAGFPKKLSLSEATRSRAVGQESKRCKLGSFRSEGVEGMKKSPQVEVPVHGRVDYGPCGTEV